MNEITIAPLVPAATSGNLTNLIAERAWFEPNRTMMSRPLGDGWQKVSAQELLKAYQSNEQDANAKYVGKAVEVSGEIAEITGDTTPKIIVAVPDEIMEGIVVSIDKRYDSDVANLKTGDKVVFKGFCSGYLQLSGVIVNDAVLVKE
jgi:uncharacterized protein (DUF1330 family)